MKLKTGVIVGIVAGLLAGVGFWAIRPGRPPAASAATGVTLPPPPPPNADGISLERDHTAVFQRAFWRRPTPADRILHAERRDWQVAGTGVEKWQWFIAVQPGPAFRDWLLKDNPFDLVPVPADAPLAPLSAPPNWFPPAAELMGFTRYRNREGRYQVFHDAAQNRLFATDEGGGFAAARK